MFDTYWLLWQKKKKNNYYARQVPTLNLTILRLKIFKIYVFRKKNTF